MPSNCHWTNTARRTAVFVPSCRPFPKPVKYFLRAPKMHLTGGFLKMPEANLKKSGALMIKRNKHNHKKKKLPGSQV